MTQFFARILLVVASVCLTLGTSADALAQESPSHSEPTAEADDPEPKVPFSYADFTWMNGQSRQTSFPLATKYVTFSLYLDVYYAFSSNHPRDDTLTGSATVGRHNEFQLSLASIGAEWNYKNVIGRLFLQFGNILTIVQDLDGTVQRGRNLTMQNLRYIREATLGYHFDVAYGLNIEAGIFMSYIGLESYLTAENWNYNRSLICEFTPFYFQGLRMQFFPLKNLKIEPWLMNGWQSYGKWNYAPSFGMAVRWNPTEWLALIGNFYFGSDTRGTPGRKRFHHDNSVVVRMVDAPASKGLSRLAFSINSHFGFQRGGDGFPQGPADAHVLGSAAALRAMFARNLLAFTVRLEGLTNPSRYLATNPAPGLFAAPGTSLKLWGLTTTFEVMPTDFFGVRAEIVYRQANQPFFAGPAGTTSADGFQGSSMDNVDLSGVPQQTLFTLSSNFRL